ncbi:SgcJ/EcaC family oxidoreductase [Halosimplex litoreum]|uniref:SgcJ/EcaC family oxidoreductase n=1 Tax=Halosimplex litoreum TaxID=1198301 RepID=A0A7U3WAI5_9EURY|nr:SgcJ/EcaC family oxidoreductase [Halosimplex litoreum]QPV64630.1 SgcJ/EcaC family oxidoreductase [Halosimplex litoreum]
MDETDTETREVVDGQLAAYNDGDAEAFASHFAEDAVIAPLSGDETTAEGREAIREQYADLFAAYPDLNCAFAERLTVGPFEAVRERVAGMDDPMEALAVYEVREGAIRRLWLGHA